MEQWAGPAGRGSMQYTGRALATLGLTAAVVAYNLRELENWHAPQASAARTTRW